MFLTFGAYAPEYFGAYAPKDVHPQGIGSYSCYKWLNKGSSSPREVEELSELLSDDDLGLNTLMENL